MSALSLTYFNTSPTFLAARIGIGSLWFICVEFQMSLKRDVDIDNDDEELEELPAPKLRIRSKKAA
ncbi:hypothetical protein [Microvirga yunnanensis]|uniref:hypothetical protein n=1 Tax=Microvirga yunnanensis TaxID=2953740 RepID=UPI0021CA6B73|nr:hypothetical protein [Microvirga sp. HBU65207]